MRPVGFPLIAIGFLLGAFAAVTSPGEVLWSLYLPALGAGVAGLAARRRGRSQAAADADSHWTKEGSRALHARLQGIGTKLEELEKRREALDVYDIRHQLDELFVEDLSAFVRDRHKLAERHGLQAYADLMSHFAAGERYLNRAWCASADGYIDEVKASLERAAEEFGEALARFPRVG